MASEAMRRASLIAREGLASDDSPLERARVQEKVGPVVLRWLMDRIHQGRMTFYIGELTDYAKRHTGCAPDSPRRIMALLREEHGIEVRCFDRARSLYRIYPPGNGPGRPLPKGPRPAARPPSRAVGRGAALPRASWECTCGAAEDAGPVARCFCG